MQDSDIPYKFAEPWAINASGTLVTDPIPVTTAGTAAASQSLGFPPATAIPTGAGGTPPAIWDFNGILKYTTEWLRWLQAGGEVPYDATFQTAIGGYPKGAIVASASVQGRKWYSTADNNTSDPDTGGANWVNLFATNQATIGHQWLPPGAFNGGTLIQWGSGTNSTGADFVAFDITFPNSCLQVIACEGAPFGWTSGQFPSIFGTQQLFANAFALYVTRWNGTAWALTGGVTYRYVAIGY